MTLDPRSRVFAATAGIPVPYDLVILARLAAGLGVDISLPEPPKQKPRATDAEAEAARAILARRSVVNRLAEY